MHNEDKLYGIRISFNFGNPITLELKGAGRGYIIPGKDYFFDHAPIEFINYLAQLKSCGVSYKITTDKKGCFNTFDLKNYNNSPRVNVLRNYRMPSKLEKIETEPTEEDKAIVATPEEIVKVEPVPVEVPQPEEDVPTEPEVVEEPIEDLPEEQTGEEETFDEEDLVIDEAEVEEPHIYTEAELKNLSKSALLAIAEELGLEVSDINTKKEIREAILGN